MKKLFAAVSAAVTFTVALSVIILSVGHSGGITDAGVPEKEKNGEVVPVFSFTGTADADILMSPVNAAPGVSAKSAILIDTSNGRVLYEKDADARRPMASTTKIMTAILAIEEAEPEKEVSIPKAAVGIEGSSAYLTEGEKLTVSDLVYALMLRSANDAAAALAIEISGDTDSFAGLMNGKAEELGLTNTHFTNPHGLYDEDHYTSARDLAVLSAYALENDEFRKTVSTVKTEIPLNNGEGIRVLVNHNKMLLRYEGAIGVKTGFTKKSGRCLVSAAERDGITLVAVTLDAPDDWRDHTSMLNYGFSLLERVCLVGEEGISGVAEVVGGKTESFTYSYKGEFSVNLPRGEHNITSVTELNRFYYAPIEKGETVGGTVFYDGETEVGYVELISDEDVEKRYEKLPFLEWLFSIFR